MAVGLTSDRLHCALKIVTSTGIIPPLHESLVVEMDDTAAGGDGFFFLASNFSS
jgi:hypothetical protein